MVNRYRQGTTMRRTRRGWRRRSRRHLKVVKVPIYWTLWNKPHIWNNNAARKHLFQLRTTNMAWSKSQLKNFMTLMMCHVRKWAISRSKANLIRIWPSRSYRMRGTPSMRIELAMRKEIWNAQIEWLHWMPIPRRSGWRTGIHSNSNK